jgi:transcriptional regulator with XRE-family HTH domain
MTGADWQTELREARRRMGLSQRAIAQAASISIDSVRAYERGRRRPTRQHLVAMIEALQVDRAWRNRVLLAAGFAPDGIDQRPPNINDWWLTREEAAAEIARYPWPSFVITERAEVVAANTIVQQLWNVDLWADFPTEIDRNLMIIASDPRVASRCVHWRDAFTIVATMFKTFHRSPERIDEPTPYFAAVLRRFLEGDPKYVGPFAEIWQEAPDQFVSKIRFAYPMAWDVPGCGIARFRCIVSTANESDGLALNDWIPEDAASWAVIERMMAASDGRGASK